MNRKQLVNAVAAQTGNTNKEVDAVLKGFQDVITAVVAKGEPVNVSGFCKFVKVDRPARMGRNPATGARITIQAKNYPHFSASKNLKERVEG